jgi:hypothetical protein
MSLKPRNACRAALRTLQAGGCWLRPDSRGASLAPGGTEATAASHNTAPRLNSAALMERRRTAMIFNLEDWG